MREAADDIETHDVGVSYNYRTGPHTFGVEMQYQKRAPDSVDNTDSYKLGAFWRIDFTRPARRLGAERPRAPGAAGPADADSFRLTVIAPGMPLAVARRALAKFGIEGGITRPDSLVYEMRLLAEIDQRQRLALVHERGRVTKVALIIDLEGTGRPGTAEQLFERVRESFLRRYGAPVGTFEEGEFSATLVEDVKASRFIRIIEWQTSVGTVRLGIPRRLDRQVRIEAQLAPVFPPPRETLWSIDRVR